ncbi:MAG: sugar phosphate isomerase/epimerase [Spirochaetales bacterium]|nr:sugar phosphate isomerase/epimerase [Spirochaetales bacterium]
MNKIGISIPWDYLSGKNRTSDAESLKEIFPDPIAFIDQLKENGVSSIELRHRDISMPVSDMKTVFRLLKKMKIGFSIHSDNLTEHSDWNFNTIFPWVKSLSTVYSVFPELMVTLHPFCALGSSNEILSRRTADLLIRLQKKIDKYEFPITLALENQRSKGMTDPGTIFTGVLDIVNETGISELGTCWDMGHSTANNNINANDFPLYPESDFVFRTVHTHIHDLGPNGKTHWPIKENKVPFRDYISRLQTAEYNGIYNLELSFSRFKDEENGKTLILDSIIKLSEMLTTT